MNIYEGYILRGEKAKKEAKRYVRSERLLEHYAIHGWVPEEKLVDFIGYEEALEDVRLGEYQKQHPELADKVGNLIGKGRQYLAPKLHYSYNLQLNRWNKHRPK